MPCASAALVLVALTTSSYVDTIHGFSESFSLPQHLTFGKTNANTRLSLSSRGSRKGKGTRTGTRGSLSRNKRNTFTNQDANGPGTGASSGSGCGPTSSFPTDSHSHTALFYAPNPQPTSQTAPMVAQAFFASHNRNRNPTKPKTRAGSNMPLSNSVLSSSDTLPSFPTAHGLLSPETVMRMEVMTSNRKCRDKAVDMFLEKYKNEGPMACLPMLSDENVLPRLTEAMRDILMWTCQWN